jgi:hypothetical protein
LVNMEDEMRSATRSGVLFAVLFAAAGAVSTGTLAGSFADPDRVFVERFADEGSRIQDIVGGYLLALAALAFLWFAYALAAVAPTSRVPIILGGAATAGGMMLAAVSWATVPMSIWFGSLVDDPGLQEGQAVLPQFGYVALTMGAMLPAAALMIIVATSPGLLPRWLQILSYPAAALVAFTALIFMPLFIFVAWVVAAAASHRPSAHGEAAS